MGFSAIFITRPVATLLLAIGLFLAGGLAYQFLPVAALPSVDIPTIVVFASRPGADPETIANSVAAPLERRLSEIGGVTEITSISSIGYTSIIIQFDLGRDIHSAGSDVMAAINAATAELPSDLPIRPYYKKFNPAEAPGESGSNASKSAAWRLNRASTPLSTRGDWLLSRKTTFKSPRSTVAVSQSVQGSSSRGRSPASAGRMAANSSSPARVPPQNRQASPRAGMAGPTRF